MTLRPVKHEKVAIFRRKMSEFRMFLGFREQQNFILRNAKKSVGIKGSNTFEPNIINIYSHKISRENI